MDIQITEFQMWEGVRTQQLQQYNLRLLLYVGLLLSQTQLLYNLALCAPPYSIPNFTLFYFLTTTPFLLYLMLSYGFFFQRTHAVALQFYEHIVMPLSALVASLLLRGESAVAVKVVGVLLLGLQSALVGVKIVYFNSVSEQLAQISTVNKLVRLVKLNLMAVVPVVVGSQLGVVAILSVCQMLSSFIFLFKFTYQRVGCEYILLVGMFCGLISAIEDILETLFGFSYLYVGEMASLYFYLAPDNYLTSLLHLKYLHSLAHSPDAKHDDDYLAGFLFLQECLLADKQTLPISPLARNEATLQATLLLERLTLHRSTEEAFSDQELLLNSQVDSSQREIALSLFRVAEDRFSNTVSYACFEFLVKSAVDLGGGLVSRGLVLYYRHVERKKGKTGMLDRCKYELLYEFILRSFAGKEGDGQQVRFIEFSSALKQLNEQMESCIANEIKLVEYLADEDKKVELFPDARLMLRHRLKTDIRSSIARCTTHPMYTCSNEFKFLFILFHMCIEKKLEGAKQSLRKLFLSPEAEQMLAAHDEHNLVVLAGFNSGEIVNSNEVFKNHFGITLNSFSRNNISEFIPTEKQRSRHNHLMAASHEEEREEEREGQHATYQCLLMVEKEFNNIKLKVIEEYSIATRLYYEHHSSFHYVCCLTSTADKPENVVTLLRKDCENFESKGFSLSVYSQKQVTQLDEPLQLCDIEFNYEGYNSMSLSAKMRDYRQNEPTRPKYPNTEYYLIQKLTLIENKLLQEITDPPRQYPLANLLELVLILGMIGLLGTVFLFVGNSVDDLSFVLMSEKSPVRNAQLVRNKIFLMQQIMTFAAQTNLFPDNLCANAGITKLRSYMRKMLLKDLKKNTDSFIGLATVRKNYSPMMANLYARQFSPVPYLMNYKVNVTYQKYIQLMKSQTFQWLEELSTATINYQFYSSLFPSILQSSTIDNPNSLYYLIDSDVQTYTASFLQDVQMLEGLICLAVTVCVVVVVGLRLRDSWRLVGYLKVVEFLESDLLGVRLRELKYSLGQLHRLRSNRIEGVDIDNDFVVALRADRKEAQHVPLSEFTNWQLNHRSDFDLEDSDTRSHSEEKPLMHSQDPPSRLPASPFLRTALYNRVYLLVVGGVLVGLIVAGVSLLELHRKKVETLAACDDVAEELSRIQQKYINLVAYDWLKVLSLQYSMSFSAATSLFQESISSLMASTYQAKIEAAYSKDLSDQILYGNVCSYFLNSSSCESYRNGIFGSGLSMLLPFSAKQSLQIDGVSSNYSYYIDNLCDKSWLLFEGVIPMTNKIASYGLQEMNDKMSSGVVGQLVGLAALGALLLFLTACCQYRRYNCEQILREEVLSLDTVSNLYAINEFKPFFNKIYYS